MASKNEVIGKTANIGEREAGRFFLRARHAHPLQASCSGTNLAPPRAPREAEAPLETRAKR